MITETISPLLRVAVVKLTPVWPATAVPFTCHWYVGVLPPLVGLAVNVTLWPAQLVGVFEVIETIGATVLVVIVMGVLVVVAGLAHGSLLVSCTVTWSLLASVVVVNVAAVSPATGLPLMNHW